MSLPINQNSGNPANPSGQVARNMRDDVTKRSGTPTTSDWIITWSMLGMFGAGIIATLLK